MKLDVTVKQKFLSTGDSNNVNAFIKSVTEEGQVEAARNSNQFIENTIESEEVEAANNSNTIAENFKEDLQVESESHLQKNLNTSEANSTVKGKKY